KELYLINKLSLFIKEKRIIRFKYEDKTSSFDDYRIVHPYLIGELKTTGNLILTGWFVPTPEQSWEHPENFGNYLINRIEELQPTNEYFKKTAFGYKGSSDSRMKRIIYCTPPNTLGR
ncbi:MAG: hypothetical protein K2Q22_07130, partial [Cytophagales bacterium]|nr:hypothetical protein [Cytophagales bacterium]